MSVRSRVISIFIFTFLPFAPWRARHHSRLYVKIFVPQRPRHGDYLYHRIAVFDLAQVTDSLIQMEDALFHLVEITLVASYLPSP